MKKQQTNRKGLRWAILAAVLVVLVVGVVLVLSLFGKQEPAPATEPSASQQTEQTAQATEPEDTSMKIYWNAERRQYVAKGVNGASGRMPRSDDGLYYIRFAVDGEQIDLPVADRTLVDQIDTFDYMGLVFDENGIIVDFRDVYEFTGGVAADHHFVEKIDGTTYSLNTSGNYKGVSYELEIPETAVVYDVGGEGLMVGLPGTINVDDEIIAIKNYEGEIVLVYVLPYPQPGDVYWNMNRMYDSVTGMTTRPTTVTGYYEFEMAFGGEIVTVRTRDMNVASAMDKSAAKCMGLIFDEDGLVSGTVSASVTAGGSVLGSWHHITSIQGDTFVVEKFSGSDKGSIMEGTRSDKTKIVNVSAMGTPGEYLQWEDLREGDQVHCLTDVRGRLAYVFVISRLSNTAKLVWNVERMYDSTLKETTRVPAADGYYYITLACDGGQIVCKTNDKAIATKIDSSAARCWAVELDGDVITAVLGTSNVTWGGVTASWYTVQTISEDGTVATAKKTGDKNNAEYGNVVDVVIGENTKVYNVSSAAKVSGEETTVKEGDTIHCLHNRKGEIVIVYIVSRPMDIPVAWNITRKYDSVNKCTTRERQADGYYHFDLAVNGRVKTYRVYDQEVANELEATAARCRGVVIEGDVITAVYSCSNVRGANGTVEVSWAYVTQVGQYSAKAEKRDGTQAGEKYDITFAPGCKVYNISNAYEDHQGEETTLKVGDLVHCLKNHLDQTTYIFVIERVVDGKIGWNVDRQWDSVNLCTKRTPDADGWYYITMAIDGEQKLLKTKDVEVVNTIDKNPAKCPGLLLDGDVIKRAFGATSIRGCEGGAGGGSWVTVTEVTETGYKAIKTGTGSDAGQTFDIKFAEDCQVFNVSSQVTSHVGEYGKVEYGAVIHSLVNANKEATVIYVISRGISGAQKGYCNVCKQEVSWVKYDGSQALVNGIHYYLDSDVHLQTYATTAGGNITLFLNGHTLSSDSRVLKLNSNTTLNIYDSKLDGSDIGGKIVGKGISQEEADTENKGSSEGGTIMLWGNNVLNLYSGTITYEKGEKAVTNGGVVAGNGEFNMYGGTITGGIVTGSGANVRMFNGIFNMYGGTVGAGTASRGTSIACQGSNADRCGLNLLGGTVEGDAYAEAVVPISVGGNIKVKELFLTLDKKLTIAEELTSGAKIGVSMASADVFLENAPKDLSSVFTSDEFLVIYDKNAKTMALKAEHEHCACGGKLDHAHTSVGWSKWDGTTQMKTGKSYFLTQDVTIDQWIQLSGGNTSLCLNGHTITSASRAFKLINNATLNICDCAGTGKIVGTGLTEEEAKTEQKGTSEGGVVMIWGSNTLNLYGGTLVYEKGEYAVRNGGVVAGNGVFNMYGGTISGGIATSNGGNVRMYNGNFFMYGGTVTGGKATNGADVAVEGSATRGGELSLLGGTVGDVYTDKNTNSIIGGKVQVSKLYLPDGKKLTVGTALTSGAKIGLSMQNPGVFLENASESDKGYFTSQGLTVKFDSKAKTLSLYLEPHKHCVCGGGADHTCTQADWQPLSGNVDFGKLESGNYYLLGDVNVTGLTGINDKQLSLCLNGFDLTTAQGRVFGSPRRSTLNITDCSYDSKVGTWGGTIYGGSSIYGGIMYLQTEAELNIYGGNFTGGEGMMARRGGLFCIAQDGAPDTNGDGKQDDTDPQYASVMNIYNGNIYGGKASRGGNIDVLHVCTLNLYGGTIQGGQATTADWSGTTIKGQGGNIAFDGSANVNVYGGRILGGTADEEGNAVLATGFLQLLGGKVEGSIYANTKQAAIGGNVQLDEIQLAPGKTLTLAEDLTADASIGLSMVTPGVFMKDVADLSAFFTSLNEDYVIFYSGSHLRLRSTTPGHEHCVCNGAQPAGHQCDLTEWTAWTATDSLPTAYGNYYLTDYVNLETYATVNAAEVNLCLNGFTVTSQSRAIKLMNVATLTICDCQGTGKLVGKGLSQEEADTENKGSSEGGTIMLWGINTLNLYSGTLTYEQGEKSVSNGGVVAGNGTFNMYGGTITGGIATGSGANVRMFNGVFNMYAGTVAKGTAARGSSVAGQGNTASRCGVNLLGGTVEGDVYHDTIVPMAVGGDVKIADVYLQAGCMLTQAQPLTEQASIGLTMADPGVFMENVETDISNVFTATNGVVTYEAAAKTLSVPKHIHCVCGGSYVHTCSDVEWKALGGNVDFGALASGNYYLVGKVTVTGLTGINDKQLSICLNGHDIETNMGRAFAATQRTTLNITDCSYDSENGTWGGTVYGGTSIYGGIIYTQTKTELNIYGGNFTGGQGLQARIGGLIVLAQDGAASNADPAEQSVMNLYNGNIYGGKAGRGGNLHLMHRSVLNIYGGTIRDGEAALISWSGGSQKGLGGNIGQDGGTTVNVYGGQILGGTSAAGGDGVYSLGAFNMQGGRIEKTVYVGGTASVGGDVRVSHIEIASGKQLTLASTLTGTEKIKITMAVPGVFMEDVEDLSAHFESTDEAFAVTYLDGDMVLESTAPEHKHCLCNGTPVGDHSCNELEWTPWSSTTSLPTTAGNYYLTDHVTLATYATVSGVQVNLCLNGFTVTSDSRVYKLTGNATLSITDCQGTGTMTGKGLTEAEATAEQSGTSEGGTVMIWGSNTLNLYGGTLAYEQGGYAVKRGGVVAGNGVFNMYAGDITGGKATNEGGNVRIYNGKFNMYGGAISGGTGSVGPDVSVGGTKLQETGVKLLGGTAGQVYLEHAITNSVGGTVQITNLYLKAGFKLNADTEIPFATGASIGITMAEPGVFMENVATDLSGYFDSVNTAYTDEYNAAAQTMSLVSAVVLPAHEDHCICAGKSVGLGDHTSCSTLTWTAWESTTSLPTTAGNYYLTDHVALTTYATVSGAQVNLCLNDFTVTSESRVFKLTNSSQLNITDCGTKGEIIGKGLTAAEAPNEQNGKSEGGVVMMWNSNTTFRLYNGILTYQKGDYNVTNGGVLCSGGTFAMYGGTVRNGQVAGMGANLYMHRGTMTIYGGTVRDGSAKSGGNIGCIGSNVLSLTNVTLSGGKATQYGANLYTTDNVEALIVNASVLAAAEGNAVPSVHMAGGSMTLMGKVVISGNAQDLYVTTGKRLTVDGLTEGSCVEVTLQTATDKFATVNEYTQSKYIASDDTAYSVIYNDDRTLSLAAGHIHCLCAGAYDGQDHTHTNTQVWEAWDGTATLEDGKFYYLTKDVTLAATANIATDTSIHICLNGYELTRENARTFNIYGTLDITDCGSTGILSSSASHLAPVFYVKEKGVFNFYGGQIKAYKNVAQAGVGGISDENSSNAHTEYPGVMNMFGGTITGNTVTTSGGAITLWNGSTMNIYGGTVTGGTATTVAGNIYVGGGSDIHSGCTLNIYGGTVTKGTSSSGGGNIYVGGKNDGTAPGILNIYGGTVSDGTAKEGGNICLQRAEAVISGGTVSGGTTTNGSGGNIQLLGQEKNTTTNLPQVAGKLTVSGDAVIKDGYATFKGGNMYIQWMCQLTLGGNALITGGEAKDVGGGICCFSMKPTISGKVRIVDNKVSDLYLDENANTTNTLTLGELEEGAWIGITMRYPRAFTNKVAEAVKAFFFPNDDVNYQIVWEGEKLVLKAK